MTLKIDYKDIHLFSKGNFNNRQTTEEALGDNVQFYKDFKVMADIKFSHEDTKADRDKKYDIFKNFPFSLGKIPNQRIEDGVLIGDYANVFEPVKYWFDNNLVTVHSAEIYNNVKSKTTGKTYKAVVTAVALLPAGELPALYEVFKPYLITDENKVCGDETLEAEQKVLSEKGSFSLDAFNIESDFEYESKQIYYFSQEENSAMLTEKLYNHMVSKYSSAGLTVHSFDVFSKMKEGEQEAWLDEQDNALKKKNEADKSNSSAVPDSSDDPVKLNNKIADLEKQFANLIKEKNSSDKERYSALKETIDELKREKKEGEVVSFVHKYSKGETPSIPIALEDTAIAILMSVSKDEKVNFSIKEGSKETNQEDLVKHFFSCLPKITSKTTKEIYKTKDGVEITAEIRANYEEGTPDQVIEQDLYLKKYSVEKGISYDKAYEIAVLNK